MNNYDDPGFCFPHERGRAQVKSRQPRRLPMRDRRVRYVGGEQLTPTPRRRRWPWIVALLVASFVAGLLWFDTFPFKRYTPW